MIKKIFTYISILSSLIFHSQETNEKVLVKTINTYPSLSPDDSKIYFHSNRLGNYDIYVQEISTGTLKQLTISSANDRTPSVSPDGSKIVFVSTRDGNYDIFIMNNNGSNQVNLTRRSNVKDIHPYWSPDGKSIIFNSTRDGKDYDLYSMDIYGKSIKKLRRNSGEATHAQISPDGNKIIFRKFYRNETKQMNSEIVLLNLKTEKESRITNHPGIDNYPSWSNDGNYIYFSSNRNGKNGYHSSIYAYHLHTKETSQLTFPLSNQEDTTPIINKKGNLIYFSRWVAEQTVNIYSQKINLE